MVPGVFVCGGQEIPLKNKPSVRAKRLSLRVSAKEGAFVLTVPPRATSSQIKAFLKQCTPWVEKQLKHMHAPLEVAPGQEIALGDMTFMCVIDPLRRKPALCTITQTLRLPPKTTQKDLHAVFKKRAQTVLSAYALRAAKAFGAEIEKITIKDTKSRWGSCSATKNIALSWRLILTPSDVAEYVCIHEAAHLLHMNHSKDFWRAVAKLSPHYKAHRHWLKTHGARLMRI